MSSAPARIILNTIRAAELGDREAGDRFLLYAETLWLLSRGWERQPCPLGGQASWRKDWCIPVLHDEAVRIEREAK